MAIIDANGLLIAVYTASVSPHEVTLVHDTLDAAFGFDLPQRLIGERTTRKVLAEVRVEEFGHAKQLAAYAGLTPA